MTAITPLQGAATAVRNELGKLEQTAQRVAAEGASGPLAERMVDLSIRRSSVAANVAVARMADELIGSLLDVLG